MNTLLQLNALPVVRIYICTKKIVRNFLMDLASNEQIKNNQNRTKCGPRNERKKNDPTQTR